MLNAGTIVRVEVESVSPTVQSYTIQREGPRPPVVLDSAGDRTKLTPVDAIGAVEVFGQHELAELEDEQTQADRLEEQLDRYQDTDVPGKLRGRERLALDEAAFTEGSSRVDAARLALDQYRKSASLTDLAATIDDIGGAPQAERLSRVTAALEGLHQALVDLGAQGEISAARADWHEATTSERENYGKVLREFAEEGLDPGKYIAAKGELASVKASKPRLKAKANEIKELLKEPSGMLDELRAHETAATERLHTAIRSANSATGGVVVVRPMPTNDRSHVVDVIKARVAGQRIQIVAAVQDPAFSPQALAEAIRVSSGALAELEIKGAQSSNLVEAGEELARELEELTVGLDVEVLLKVDGIQGLRSMDQLSKGQRATALLLLLLGATDAPLIIDQPRMISITTSSTREWLDISGS